jgi:hypothetical protein
MLNFQQIALPSNPERGEAKRRYKAASMAMAASFESNETSAGGAVLLSSTNNCTKLL